MTTTSKNIVALTGDAGGAKLVYGLARIVPPEKLTVVVNTGDNFEHLGLHISPALDAVIYTLAGLAVPGSSSGVKNESWNMMTALARYGGPTWVQLGDRELATHLLRNQWLHEGYPHGWITKELCRRLGVRCTVLPMTEQPVQTILQTDEGEFGVQEYVGQKQGKPVVKSIHFEGIDEAQPGQEVINALRKADIIVFCPSDPLLGLDPILALPNMRRIIAASPAAKIGVSPIVKSQTQADSTAKLMAELGLDVSPVGVANHLKDVLTGFVIDPLDEAHQDTITEMGLRTLVTPLTMKNDEARVRLTQAVLDFATSGPG